MGIGKNMKILRQKYNLSQKDLALIAGVSDKAVSTWENEIKDPRMGTIQKIADHFGIPKSHLIEDDGLTNPIFSRNDSNSIQDKISKILNELNPESGITLQNDGKTMSNSEKELLRISLENVLRLAQQISKQNK